MVVFLLLGVVWAAVLVPPWLQARRQASPAASIASFRSQLSSLGRATPAYDVDPYGAGAWAPSARPALSGPAAPTAVVQAFDDHRPWPPIPPGGLGAAVTRRDPGAGPPPSCPAAARPGPAGTSPARPGPAGRRAAAYRRRRQVLGVLSAATAGTAALALGPGGWWVPVAVGVGGLLAGYLSLLIRWGRREAERHQKVRYLMPIRAPRPAVVVIGRRAAR